MEAANPLPLAAMRDNEGFDILHNGVPRTFRDLKETAHEAARFAKSRAKGDIIEIADRLTAAEPDAGGWPNRLSRGMIYCANRHGEAERGS